MAWRQYVSTAITFYKKLIYKNMKPRFLLPCLLTMASITALANGDITGKVFNKETGEPMDFANVQLINAKTGKPLPIGTNTDENGFFSLKGVADGKYLVRISNLGSVAQEREANVAGGNVDLGAIVSVFYLIFTADSPDSRAFNASSIVESFLLRISMKELKLMRSRAITALS